MFVKERRKQEKCEYVINNNTNLPQTNLSNGNDDEKRNLMWSINTLYAVCKQAC